MTAVRTPTPGFVGESGPHHPFVCATCDKPGECDGDCDGVQPFDDAHVHHAEACQEGFRG